MRDLELAARLAACSDDVLIGPVELSALIGYAVNTIRQRKCDLPPNDPRFKMRWSLGSSLTLSR
ncbi:MAG: hypothetical protein JWN23_341 [Rhodocyclales bacterium]|nr:hypothetical protein [Rhodocyclales bacterium]